MYTGRLVETGPTERVLARPLHPYTLGLLDAIVDLDDPIASLRPIPGALPDVTRLRAAARSTRAARSRPPSARRRGPSSSRSALPRRVARPPASTPTGSTRYDRRCRSRARPAPHRGSETRDRRPHRHVSHAGRAPGRGRLGLARRSSPARRSDSSASPDAGRPPWPGASQACRSPTAERIRLDGTELSPRRRRERASRHPDRVPGSVLVAQPAPERAPRPDRAAGRARTRHAGPPRRPVVAS